MSARAGIRQPVVSSRRLGPSRYEYTLRCGHVFIRAMQRATVVYCAKCRAGERRS